MRMLHLVKSSRRETARFRKNRAELRALPEMVGIQIICRPRAGRRARADPRPLPQPGVDLQGAACWSDRTEARGVSFASLGATSSGRCADRLAEEHHAALDRWVGHVSVPQHQAGWAVSEIAVQRQAFDADAVAGGGRQ
jgi:hypothetical protein